MTLKTIHKKTIKFIFAFILLFVMSNTGLAFAAEGDIWLTPVTTTAQPGTQGHAFDVHIDTAGKYLGSFNIRIHNSDTSKVEVDTSVT